MGMWWGWWWLPAGGQVVDPGQGAAGAVPLPPASRVLDEDGLFQRDRRRLAAISERLVQFGTEHEWPVYLVVCTGLLGTTPDERAAVLHEAWVGSQREGLVLVLETDSKAVGLGRSLELADAAAGASSLWRPRITPCELDEIRAKVGRELDGVDDPVELADRLSAGWVGALADLLDRRQAGGGATDRLRFALIVVGAACVVGLSALVAARVVARADARQRLVHRLPEVRVEVRLGAPYGGGRVSSRSFRGGGPGKR